MPKLLIIAAALVKFKKVNEKDLITCFVQINVGVCGRPRTSSRVQLEGSRYLHGDEVTFSCPRNYDLFGKAKLRCVDRKWDSPIPECKGTIFL